MVCSRGRSQAPCTVWRWASISSTPWLTGTARDSAALASVGSTRVSTAQQPMRAMALATELPPSVATTRHSPLQKAT